MKKNILILLLSLLIASTNVAAANEDDSFNEEVTISAAIVDDGVDEMLKEVDSFNNRRGLKGGGIHHYYEWRRIARTFKTGGNRVCRKCDAEEICDSEDDYTATSLEHWIRDNKGSACQCSTFSSTALGKQGYKRTCYDHDDCECACTSYCHYSLKCKCI